MRVVLVSPYDLDVPGGVQAHVRALAVALRRTGDEVTIVGPGGRAGGGSGEVGGEVRVGRSIAVAFNGARAPLLVDPRGVGRARAAIRAADAEVVHVHEPLVPLLGLGTAFGHDRPLVTTNHVWSDRSGLYRLVAPVGRRIVARTGAALVVSDAARAYHAAALGLDASAFLVVPNGVDVARFADPGPVPAGAEPSAAHAPRRRIVFVGRLEPRKGVAVLVDAFERLAARRDDVELVVVGTGPERSRVDGLVDRGLAVRALGTVTQDALPAVLASADVVVAPSIGGESFGIVLLEAMAAGRPLVASDLPGYRCVIERGDEALVVAPGDPAALADGIERVLDEPGLAAALVARGGERVREHDWPIVAARVREAYGRAVAAG
jgi:phosphatidylinositol alpha-mannosyltransferase